MVNHFMHIHHLLFSFSFNDIFFLLIFSFCMLNIYVLEVPVNRSSCDSFEDVDSMCDDNSNKIIKSSTSNQIVENNDSKTDESSTCSCFVEIFIHFLVGFALIVTVLVFVYRDSLLKWIHV